jgi:hypothetical protein
MSALQPWPVCPRPQPDESLPSWFERIGAEYRMTPNALLSSFDLSDGPVAATAPEHVNGFETHLFASSVSNWV